MGLCLCIHVSGFTKMWTKVLRECRPDPYLSPCDGFFAVMPFCLFCVYCYFNECLFMVVEHLLWAVDPCIFSGLFSRDGPGAWFLFFIPSMSHFISNGYFISLDRAAHDVSV